jgi:hypothetical protein
LDLKGKHLLTLEELISAKSHWTVPTAACRIEEEESSDDLYDANDDEDASKISVPALGLPTSEDVPLNESNSQGPNIE